MPHKSSQSSQCPFLETNKVCAGGKEVPIVTLFSISIKYFIEHLAHHSLIVQHSSKHCITDW